MFREDREFLSELFLNAAAVPGHDSKYVLNWMRFNNTNTPHKYAFFRIEITNTQSNTVLSDTWVGCWLHEVSHLNTKKLEKPSLMSRSVCLQKPIFSLHNTQEKKSAVIMTVQLSQLGELRRDRMHPSAGTCQHLSTQASYSISQYGRWCLTMQVICQSCRQEASGG